MCIKDAFIMLDWDSALGRLQTMYPKKVEKMSVNFSNWSSKVKLW